MNDKQLSRAFSWLVWFISFALAAHAPNPHVRTLYAVGLGVAFWVTRLSADTYRELSQRQEELIEALRVELGVGNGN